ncbi:hypothetical protein LEP1GSC045_4237 [Leptospira interrogans serovar Pomona str. Kennewicki LC82-25]|nr:hypothetical protein LEP1GSC045_4237 [Leptospira interrogans serovar Pomona str. Kennewicki LC82-25]EMF31471.1 hypothetical protein LEP1GSC201_0722 [Leptospira interrogans serovar Pomona str. Fox 32256]EMJ60351.1 hypothetical protein LEP1GSC197_0854 [Leptospira interrogans serovar Pomona str. CSL4002]OQN92387.1 transposase [Leptospira interrogans serovar Lai]EMF32917.1 hypothetical protein LEP1GSC201_3399 [Leptospira interrogans serovar Pomona str. Fox 32256]
MEGRAFEKEGNRATTSDKQLKESEELKRLRKENVRLKDENAILKKFAAMLSREQNPD